MDWIFFCFSVNLPAFSGRFTLNLLLILFVAEVCVAGETNSESETWQQEKGEFFLYKKNTVKHNILRAL